ncbi:hypothetical protein JOC77_000434 [Peribacillus deserti]|uniref:Uncharacterized protein n=1 Tax=Peribacillus deserti TaxID=673318 RepID=A0ABS2QFE8_9BACI|nr:hypothetical protein [Peribacillus deserti]MBM7691031.1 hypothetical protein [Peribacillus deserti]
MENKSLRAVIVLGVNKGHGENRENHTLEKASSAWQELAAEMYQQTNIYVSAVAHKSKTVYHTEWGCPAGGEDTITFTSSVNYEYVKDINAWKQTVIALTKKLKSRFEQETVTIEFEDISLIYLD